jgi:hypothetical protein
LRWEDGKGSACQPPAEIAEAWKSVAAWIDLHLSSVATLQEHWDRLRVDEACRR